jgi:hypothetical protein
LEKIRDLLLPPALPHIAKVRFVKTELNRKFESEKDEK